MASDGIVKEVDLYPGILPVEQSLVQFTAQIVIMYDEKFNQNVILGLVDCSEDCLEGLRVFP